MIQHRVSSETRLCRVSYCVYCLQRTDSRSFGLLLQSLRCVNDTALDAETKEYLEEITLVIWDKSKAAVFLNTKRKEKIIQNTGQRHHY